MNENLRKILGTIIGIIFFVCIALFMTYALYRWQSEETGVNVSIVDENFEFTSDTLDVDVEGLGPVLDYNSSENITNKNVVYSDFTANNVSSNVYYMNVKLNITSITSNLLDESFKYVLLKKDTSTSKYSIVASEGDFTTFGVGYNTIVSNYTISKSPGDSFRFIVYIDGNEYNNKNLMNGVMEAQLVLEADSAEIGEGTNAASYIQSLYSDGSTLTTANIGGDSSNPSVSLNATQGIMLDNNGDYRYYGATPNNYVTFNGEEAGWRIISVSDVEDESGNTEKRVRLIRDSSIGGYSYDNKSSGTGTSISDNGSNDWSDARLMMLLNPGYETTSDLYAYEGSLYWNSKSGTCYSSSLEGTKSCDFTSIGLTNEGKSMIGQAKYYLGGNSSHSSLYASDYYNFERGTTVYSGHSTEWTGYVGIMYPSDYAYAADLSVCTQYGVNYSSDTTNCTGTDWLFNEADQWTISPYSSIAYNIFYVRSTGAVGDDYSRAYLAYGVRPVVVLESSVDIVSGSGTQSDPYRLENPVTTIGTYTVSYDANGGSDAPDLQRKVDGETITLSSDVPTRSGYIFLGWSTSEDATTATYQPGDTYTINASATLYAVWVADGELLLSTVDAGSYVMLNYNGTDTAFRLAYVEDDVPYLISSGIVGQMCTNSTGSYSLDGGCDQTWDTELPLAHSANLGYVVDRYLGSSSDYDMVENSRSVNLEDFYKITGLSGESCFGVNNDGTCGKGNDLIDIGTNYWFYDYVDDKDYGGYASVAWFDGSYIAKYSLMDMLEYESYGVRPVLQMKTGVMVTSGTGTEDDPYILSYSSEVEEPETYTVSYDANGGSGAPSSQTKTYGVNLTLSSTIPTRDGYTFLGWSTSSTATTATYESGSTYSTDSDVTLYAVWDPDEYTISYDANGGNGAPDTQTKEYGVNLTLSTTVPTRTGYTFLGWSTNPNATTATYEAGGTYSSNQAVTLYAVWGLYVNAVTHVQNLYSDGTSTSVNIGGDTSNPTVSLNATQGLMLDNNGNYRYYGANPNNYVSYNGELWRIISVSEVEDEEGSVESRVKIVRNNHIGILAYDAKASGVGTSISSDYGSDNWSDAMLMMLLNPGYETPSSLYEYEGSLYWNQKSGSCYVSSNNTTTACDFTSTSTTKGLGEQAKNLIGKTKFYLGGLPGYEGLYADDYYTSERGTAVYSGHATEWTGYVGLIYPSDYAYATDLSLCTNAGYNYAEDSDCVNNDWLYNGLDQWSITPFTSSSYNEVFITSDGYVSSHSRGAPANDYATRPVVYLKSDVLINGGNGTSKNPYKLQLEGSSDTEEGSTYTISYDANGGNGIPDVQTKTHGVDLTISSTEPLRDGYEFLGWSTSQDAKIVDYRPGDTYSADVSVVLYAVWSTYATYYIQNLYNDGSSVTTVNIAGSTSNPSVNLNATQGIMLDNNGVYRYYGASPNNYVLYNDELWRIISVENVKSSTSDTTGETRVKIIKADILTDDSGLDAFSWDSSDSTINSGYGVNDWTKADLMTELNTLYYDSTSGTCYNGWSNSSISCNFTNSGLNEQSKKLVDDAVYYLGGGIPTSANYANSYYDFERAVAVYDCSTDDGACPRATTWTGKVGLMYPSDFVYATDLSVCKETGFEYYDSNYCIDNDWLLYSNNFQWTISPNSSVADLVFYVESTASVGHDLAGTVGGVFPVVYLKSNVAIVDGQGTSDNPYKLQLIEESEEELEVYTVSYDVNGGSGTIASQSKMYGGNLTLSSTIPTKDGYEFAGWSTDSSATTATYAAGGTYSVNASTTLYAVWGANEAPTAPTYVAQYADGSGTYTSGTWTNKQVNVTISSSDTGSGVSYFQSSTDGTYWNTLTLNVSPVTRSGTTSSGTESFTLYDRDQTYYFRACDNIGNCSESSEGFNIKYDVTVPTAPTYVASYNDGSGTYTSGTWTNKLVVTVISSTDNESGISYMQYSTDKSTWSTLGFAASALAQSGTTWTGTEGWTVRERDQTYYFRACDSGGNCSGNSDAFNIKYDITAPTAPTYVAYYADGSGSYTSGNTASSQVYTDISSTDAGSGVSYIQYSTDQSSWTTFSFSISALTQSGTTWTGTEPWNYRDRDDTYYFRACDNMGLCSDSSSAFNIVYKLSCTTYTQVHGTTSGGPYTLWQAAETGKFYGDKAAVLLSTSYTFNSSTGMYTLSGTQTSFSSSLSLSTYKYTCLGSSTTSCSTLYVMNVSSATYYSGDPDSYGYDSYESYSATAYKYTSSCS